MQWPITSWAWSKSKCQRTARIWYWCTYWTHDQAESWRGIKDSTCSAARKIKGKIKRVNCKKIKKPTNSISQKEKTSTPSKAQLWLQQHKTSQSSGYQHEQGKVSIQQGSQQESNDSDRWRKEIKYDCCKFSWKVLRKRFEQKYTLNWVL
jgi:hypothetical protein